MANNINIRSNTGSTAPTDGGAAYTPVNGDGKIGRGTFGVSEGAGRLYFNKRSGGIIDLTGLKAENNLSDLDNVSMARTYLGLGTAATEDTGTDSGQIAVLGAGGKFAIGRIPTGTTANTVPLVGADGKIPFSVIPKAAVVDVYSKPTIAERNNLIPDPGLEVGDVVQVTADTPSVNGYYQVIFTDSHLSGKYESGGFVVDSGDTSRKTLTGIKVGEWDVEQGDVIRIEYDGATPHSDSLHTVTSVTIDGSSMAIVLDTAVTDPGAGSSDPKEAYNVRFMHSSLPVDHTHTWDSITDKPTELAALTGPAMLGRISGTGEVDRMTPADVVSILPEASTSAHGIVTDSAQAFGGKKSLPDGIVVGKDGENEGAITIQNDLGTVRFSVGESPTPADAFMSVNATTKALDFHDNPMGGVNIDLGTF